MSQILQNVDSRTNLVGENRMEMLMFNLSTDQVYGINVFKVKEVSICPKLTKMPKSSDVVRGVANIRGMAIPVIDLSMAIGGKPIDPISNRVVIITEYNMSTQALLVNSVERIVNKNWSDVKPPPIGATSAGGSYLTAITEVDGKLVEIVDVEKVLNEFSPLPTQACKESIEHLNVIKKENERFEVLVVDDSSVARSQLKTTLNNLGLEVISANNGRQALDILKRWSNLGDNISDHLLLVISDIEMPEMDGYTLCTEIRFDESLKGLYVVLHTSLSGGFNEHLIKKVGADQFVAKYQPDRLAELVGNLIEKRQSNTK